MKTLAMITFSLLLLPSLLLAQEKHTVRLVIQQNGQALVSELRPMTLPKGKGRVLLTDMPATLDPQSVQIRSKTSPDSLEIVDLTLDSELLSPSTLLRRHLGHTVQLILPDGKSRDGRVQKQAQLLALNEAPLFLIDGAVYSGPYDAIIYSEAPQGLTAKPRLQLNVANSGPAKQTLDIAYIVREISWSMDYVLTLDKASKKGLLSGWVTLSNHSGRDYSDCVVELLAGEPRRVTNSAPRALFAAEGMMAAKAPAAPVGDVFEYHVYPLPQPVSLADQQSRQVQLFASSTIPVSKRIVGRASALPSARESSPMKQNLDAVISFRNTQALSLGLPLPKGVLRAYQDDSGARHFLGEAPVERTPVGTELELRLGRAFDLAVERVTTEFEKTGKNSYRVAWELRLSNAKKQSQQVVLQELLPGKWKIASATQKWTKTSAGVAEFVIDVPPTRDGEPLVLKYSFTTDM